MGGEHQQTPGGGDEGARLPEVLDDAPPRMRRSSVNLESKLDSAQRGDLSATGPETVRTGSRWAGCCSTTPRRATTRRRRSGWTPRMRTRTSRRWRISSRVLYAHRQHLRRVAALDEYIDDTEDFVNIELDLAAEPAHQARIGAHHRDAVHDHVRRRRLGLWHERAQRSGGLERPSSSSTWSVPCAPCSRSCSR